MRTEGNVTNHVTTKAETGAELFDRVYTWQTAQRLRQELNSLTEYIPGKQQRRLAGDPL